MAWYVLKTNKQTTKKECLKPISCFKNYIYIYIYERICFKALLMQDIIIISIFLLFKACKLLSDGDCEGEFETGDSGERMEKGNHRSLQ